MPAHVFRLASLAQYSEIGMNVLTAAGSNPFDPPVRGDRITGERYYSPAYMQKEWDRLWTQTWHIGGSMADLLEAGDYVAHALGRDSVIMVLQEDGSVRGFFNACRHRGNRLSWSEMGGGPSITCSYHGWKWGIDGVLQHAQDADDFAGGNPCGKAKLIEVACEAWGGFVWFNMDMSCRSLRDYLGEIGTQLAAYRMENWVRVLYLTTEAACNWKVIRDNFNESYHLPTLHPELASFINDGLPDTTFEMYPDGHNRMIMKGAQPSKRSHLAEQVEAPLADLLAHWELDPKDYENRAGAARLAVQQQKRKLGPARGHAHLEGLSDSQLTDYYHYTLFPNLTFTMGPDGFQVLRSEPHPTDPEKCIFDHWYYVPVIPGEETAVTPCGVVPVAAAERDRLVYGSKSLGFVADQDLSIATGQQQGLHSRGYDGGLLTGQEKRIQRFHEWLDDVLDGRQAP